MAIDSILHEQRQFAVPEHFAANANLTASQYAELCAWAKADSEGFWGEMARNHLHFETPFHTVLDESNAPFYKWFLGGRLNASYECLDVPIKQGLGHKTAIVFEADDGTVNATSFAALHALVCQVANGLKQLGVGQGDRVVLYMPMGVQGIAAMQACARIGAIHSVVFGGFSARALADRIQDTGAKVVLTANEQLRGGKTLPLKTIVDEALGMLDNHAVTHVVVYARTTTEVPMNDSSSTVRDVAWNDAFASQVTQCEPEWVDAEHPLFILYTSGSTGKPKGILHSTAGYLLWAKLTMLWTFDIKPNDVFWCTADMGWITGHTYVTYGPLASGVTQVVFEGVPTYPHAGRFWQTIQNHAVSVFYTAPTAIRALIKASQQNADVQPNQFDLSSLRLLGSVGEPINPEAWVWYHREVGQGRCPIVDTFWQTETGGHMIAPMPGSHALVPGSATLPLPGIAAAVVDDNGDGLPPGEGGLLVVQRPWPSIARTIWGDDERFANTYFPKSLGGRTYLAGDGAVRCVKTGYFTIMGRVDDVLNVSGHRLGTMEIESALVAHPDVAEAAVVGMPDAITGEAIVAFVVLKTNPEPSQWPAMQHTLSQWVAAQIGPIAKPKRIGFGDNLPKTRSGKIMRRLLKSLARGEAPSQDTSTLENPAILQQWMQQFGVNA